MSIISDEEVKIRLGMTAKQFHGYRSKKTITRKHEILEFLKDKEATLKEIHEHLKKKVYISYPTVYYYLADLKCDELIVSIKRRKVINTSLIECRVCGRKQEYYRLVKTSIID